MTGQFPQVLAGRYEIRDLIGRGGMAEVHLGYDKRLSRIIAIKLLRSDIAGDPTFQARFRREAQSAAALNHPTIVAVYDSGEEEITAPNGATRSVPYIVMEYVEGHTVRELLGDGDAVPIPEAVEITTGVLDALEYSHRAGIVHRDIKPGNIMLTSTGAVKVMDFGIARAMEDSSATVTQTHAVVGTAQYLSPEQARGEVVDARSDLYSTGCLLYELLTGQPPFTGDSAVAIAYQHVREIPKPPSALAADVPESLDRVVLKALAKARDDRYQDAAHMRNELLAAARGMAVSAPATDTWQAPAALSSPSTTALSPAPAPGPPSPAQPPVSPDRSTENKQPRRRWWVWVLLLILLILVGSLIGLAASGLIGGKPSPTPTPTATAATVPDVSGMTEEDAKGAIEGVGLTYNRGQDVPSDTVKEGLAVSSDPGAGTSAVLGTEITVSFSSGAATAEVPNVAGMSQSEARKKIEEAGLAWGDVTTEDSPSTQEGNVVRTNPAAGTSMSRGETVSIVVSSGRTTVPDVVGKSQDEAQAAIEAAGLTYNTTTNDTKTTDSSKNDQYIVTAIDPQAGQSVNLQSSVTLTVTHYIYEATASPSPTPAPTPTGGTIPPDDDKEKGKDKNNNHG
ncbi:Stk1 family PASTA domain-containing Ser/Thr kinase [Actinomyces israelii]|uniref:non-specific serine/threonine protein kinase n=1 Tax=Actinomyces israelii TaxID=1659 RepID=A0ABT4IAM3_9ACTO|nr:Stk1 family PASTA domain-containing Ser/Thr kinase [Actinomyces israelii]MCZ0858240.1 Stk1 family PASTA domain-containing Ser/Thr kinase [Actinomyces israelii]WKR20156.1 Serine/threonine-protein kinase PknB [Actinomyces israelii]